MVVVNLELQSPHLSQGFKVSGSRMSVHPRRHLKSLRVAEGE